jgi:hypothetical protein
MAKLQFICIHLDNTDSYLVSWLIHISNIECTSEMHGKQSSSLSAVDGIFFIQNNSHNKQKNGEE